MIDEVNQNHAIDMVPTFMGAHAFPKEFSNDHDAYIDLICNEMIPAVTDQGVAIFNDVFCEDKYFTVGNSAKSCCIQMDLNSSISSFSPLFNPYCKF